MLNIRMVLEYDGSRFHGWQKQPNLRTVQAELERVLEMVLRRKIGSLHAAGRTDSGVHARGQVVHFQLEGVEESALDLSRVAYSVSSILRREVSVLRAEVVPAEFHSRTSAYSKQYSYRLMLRRAPAVLDFRRAWAIRGALDLDRMCEDAKVLVGVHDFSSFRAADCVAASPVREIFESEVLVTLPYVTYRVVGRGFLKQMVRNVVGTLVDRGRGILKGGSIEEILAARDRRAAGVTAPPYGLYLDWVHYPPPFSIPREE